MAGHDRGLGSLTRLCRELAGLGLNVGLSDARPALRVTAGPGVLLWITVDDSGEFFEWDQAGRHPVEDPAGAAALISRAVSARSGSGDGS